MNFSKHIFEMEDKFILILGISNEWTDNEGKMMIFYRCPYVIKRKFLLIDDPRIYFCFQNSFE